MRRISAFAAIFTFLLLAVGLAAAQGGAYVGIALAPTGAVNNSAARIMSYATIRVCTEPASGSPCVPLQNIYTSAALTTRLPNPTQADQYGNYVFYVPVGVFFHVQITGPQAQQVDLPYQIIGGSGGTPPCGLEYDVQINYPLGEVGCDSGVFQEFPSTHTVIDNIVQARNFLALGTTNTFNQGLDSTFSTTYGIDWPDTPAVGNLGITSLTPGSDGRLPTAWQVPSTSKISAENLNYLFNNPGCNSPATCADIPFHPIAWAPNLAFMSAPTSTGTLGYLSNGAVIQGGGSSLSITLPAPVAAGDPIIIADQGYNVGACYGPFTISDTAGNSFTSVVANSLWYVASAKAASSDTITVSFGGSCPYVQVGGWEVIGGGTLDTSNSGGTSATCSASSPYTVTSTSVVTTANDLLVGIYALEGIGGGPYGIFGPGLVNGTGATLIAPPQQTHYGGGGLGTSFSMMAEYGAATTIGSNDMTSLFTTLSGGNSCGGNAYVLAFKAGTQGNSANPAPRNILLQDLEASGDFWPLSDGQSYIFDSNLSALVPLIYGSGLTVTQNSDLTRTIAATATGTVSGSGTGGYLPIWSGSGASTTLGNSRADDGQTTPNTFTYTGSGGINASAGPISSSSDGVHAGAAQIVGNTTAPSLGSNIFALIGPNSASFTSYGWQAPTAENSTAGMLYLSAASSHISTFSFIAQSGAKCYPFMGTGGTGCDTPSSLPSGTGVVRVASGSGSASEMSGFATTSGSNALVPGVVASGQTLTIQSGGTLTCAAGSSCPSGPLTKVFSGTLALATSSIAAASCQTVTAGSVNSVAATGVLSTDVIQATPNGSLTSATGYGATGTLKATAYPTAGYINVDVCNSDPINAVTPGAVTLNLLVVR
jgi:hypothetical protein